MSFWFRVPIAGSGSPLRKISAGAAGITTGAEVQVLYDPASPREARLAIGSRTFLERNRYHMRVPILGVALLCTLGAWGWRARRISGARAAGSSLSNEREALGSAVSVGAVK